MASGSASGMRRRSFGEERPWFGEDDEWGEYEHESGLKKLKRKLFGRK
jgi:hypothetical protein